VVDTEVTVVPFPLQDTNSHPATGDVMLLGALRARLTAGQAALIFTDAHDFLNWGTDAIYPPHLSGWQRQAVGGVVLLAISDNKSFHPPAALAALGPGRMAPMVPERLPIDAAILVEAADEGPPIVAHARQQGLGGKPRIKEHVLGLTTQPIAGITQQLQGELLL
jgi:hypothetical protein